MSNKDLPKKVLVVVDPSQERAVALERALATSEMIAKKHGVENQRGLMVLTAPDFDNINSSVDNDNLHRSRDWFMDTMLQPLDDSGLDYELEISWSTDWYGTILRAAESFNAEMILLPMTHRPTDTQIFFTESIWRLIRTSNCPVLMVQPDSQTKRSVILAAVNYQSHKKDSKEVNDRIIQRGQWIAQTYGAEMHVVNAYSDSLNYPDRSILADKAQIPSANIHVQQGSADEVISSVAKEVNADIIVMGTVSRFSRWRGNTAERIISQVDCDILTINK